MLHIITESLNEWVFQRIVSVVVLKGGIIV